MYNVLADFHHGALLQSFIRLFEKRLGGNVYRPIGAEWFTEGFWKVYDHPATVEQFLGIGGATPDGTRPLNQVEGNPEPGVYLCHDIESEETNKAITLSHFLNSPIDIVIASLPYHIEPFKRLCELHPNKPKLIYQIGNAWTVEAGLAPNIMASAIVDNIPKDINFISYHQEFDLQIFKPAKWTSQFGILTESGNKLLGEPEIITDVYSGKKIYSFINCFDISGAFEQDWQLFLQIENSLPDWNFSAFGGQCRNGSCDGARALAAKMQEARFIWHTKFGGDGYGHILHNAAAVGKPMIVKKNYYAGKMGDGLLIDGETCIAIDNLSNDQIIEKINYYSEPNRYIEMSHNVYRNFKKAVDFDFEAEGIKTFLSKLI